MSASSPIPSLPTLDKLGVVLPTDIDVRKEASVWLDSFARYVLSNNVDDILSLIQEDAWWRDLLAITWDFRSFQGIPKIKQFLTDRLEGAKLSNFRLTDTGLDQPFPDLVWIRGHFTFENDVGEGNGVFRLVPTKDGRWKAYSVFTNLEGLRGFPEKLGALRNHAPNHGKWIDQRRQEREFRHQDPQVIVVGGGQSGLDIAARLKHLDVPTLVIEKNARIGDNWRGRYEALCLHDPVWYDHMPYMPFPPSWPVYTPAQKLASWLESYAEAMELNVWTSSVVTKVRQDGSGKWIVTVKREDNSERVFTVDHVVLAIGVGGGLPRMPKFPGQEEYKGQVLHSTQHKRATDHAGKKVAVVGACTSAHDISADYVDHDIDVTMVQRGPTHIITHENGMPRLMGGLYWEDGPSTEVADLIDNSMPIEFKKLLFQRITPYIREADKKTLDGLRERGFKLTDGDEGAGFFYLALKRLGGYYLDVGASQLIIDGKIKLKNDSEIERYTANGLKFKTAANSRDYIRQICGDEIGDKLTPIWGLDTEGELRTAWREAGVSNLWVMMGNLAWCRFYSKCLALQIKAKQEGLFGTRYSARST